ncbi:hypothetical protein CQW23_28482 [Capsicum baccatum]|uniref:Protein NEOXANTHIN-DEFICIENT 1 n=1 Tax=Capsicum baccatum TaxID=33114 RepID=A0A2G2VGN2_CAPBA|nr:hypothetical protein CQW23_28482 [Capsicum baccatum]
MEMKNRSYTPLGALYQLHLVKAETARAFIPKDCRLVEAFGYTLGGFFLASYDDSPAGIFDEEFPFGSFIEVSPLPIWQQVVGLPSQVGRFSKHASWSSLCKMVSNYLTLLKQRLFSAILSMNFLFPQGMYMDFTMLFIKKITALSREPKSKSSSFLSRIGWRTSSNYRNHMDIEVSEIKNQRAMSICNINLNATVSQQDSKGWMGPFIKMSLPNFSGRTKYNSNLLKYSCQIECRVRAVQPANVLGPSALDADKENSSEDHSSHGESIGRAPTGTMRNFSISVLLSKPILALEFNHLKMRVEAPTIVAACSQNTV